MSALATLRAHRLITAGVGLYAVGMLALVTKRWLDWRYGFDNGQFQQCLATVVRGDPSGLWQCGHWSPVWLFAMPFFALWPNGLTLQVLQAALLGATAVPAYALARKYLGGTAALFALIVLFYPPVVAFAYNDVHEAAFFPVLVWAMLWAIDGERYRAFALLALVAINVREDASIALAVFGIALAVHALRRGTPAEGPTGLFTGFRHPRRAALAGFALAAGAAAVSATYLALVHPYEDAGTHVGGLYRYAFARDPRELLLALASDPRRIADVLSYEKIAYVVRLLAPLALLPLLSRWSLLALPELAIILLSSNRDVWTPEFQYVALVAPWLQFGALAALRRLASWAPRTSARWLTVTAVATSAIFLIANPMHIARYQTPAFGRNAAAAALAILPSGARIELPIYWYARIAAHQPRAEPYFCDDVPWATYADDDPDPRVQQAVAQLDREIRRGDTVRTAHFGDVSVFRRSPRAMRDRSCTTEF